MGEWFRAGSSRIYESEADAVHVVCAIKPEKHEDSWTGILRFDGSEDAIKISPGNQIFRIDVLFECFTVTFEHFKFVALDLACFVYLLGQLAMGQNRNNLVSLVEIDVVDESILSHQPIVPQLLLPGQKLPGLFNHEGQSFFFGKIESFPHFIVGQKLFCEQSWGLKEVILSDRCQSELVVRDVHS